MTATRYARGESPLNKRNIATNETHIITSSAGLAVKVRGLVPQWQSKRLHLRTKNLLNNQDIAPGIHRYLNINSSDSYYRTLKQDFFHLIFPTRSELKNPERTVT